MSINPLSGDYNQIAVNIQLKNLWSLYSNPNLSNYKREEAFKNIQILKVITNKNTVKDYFADIELFKNLIDIFAEFQRGIKDNLTAGAEDDCMNLFYAIKIGYINKIFRQPKNNTLKKIKSFIETDNKIGFLNLLESYYRAGVKDIFVDCDYEFSSLEENFEVDVDIEEENELELEIITWIDEINTIDQWEKCGNMYKVREKKSLKKYTEISLFDLGSVV